MSANVVTYKDWLRQTIESQAIGHVELGTVNLNDVADIVGQCLAEGLSESATIRALRNELGLERDLSKFLAHFALTAAVSYATLNSYSSSGQSVSWLGGIECCDLCSKNTDVVVTPGCNFPSGQPMPPACLYCTCCLIPSLE